VAVAATANLPGWALLPGEGAAADAEMLAAAGAGDDDEG